MIRRIPSVTQGATCSGKDKDCTVRALANITDMPYEKADWALKAAGRTDNKGCSPRIWVPVYESFGIKMVSIFGKTGNALWFEYNYPSVPKCRSITVGKLIPTLSRTKTYAVVIKSHVFAVVGGCVIDTFDNRAQQQVIALFELQENSEDVFKMKFVE